MLKHIVVGTDFSPGWEAACKQIPALAQILGTERFTLVHVPDVHPLSASREVKDSVQPQLDDAARALEQLTGLPVASETHVGTAADALLAAAHDAEADAVLVASRGHSRLGGLFLGNVALNLARITDLPALILPDEPGPVDGPLVLATDGSDCCAAAEQLFRGLVDAAHKGLILTVSVDDQAPDHSEVLKHAKNLEQDVDNANLEIQTGNPRELIPAIAEREHASLLIVGQRGRTALADLLLGSTAEAACRAAHCPVMVVPD